MTEESVPLPDERPLPGVYFAGPIDYVEHRSPAAHRQDNWRHRFFDDLPCDLLCPICLNVDNVFWRTIIQTNQGALSRAAFLVAYFPADVATFGTPLEIDAWVRHSFQRDRPDSAVLVHPAKPGVFVESYRSDPAFGIEVVRDFPQARAWLARRLKAWQEETIWAF